ncbi:hypothetical protein BJF79_26845 [Actinomadura sp. CNU-125]|uniref:FHA domain-containing protein n=1 Tax=Actinomadura sp. CNU-125 TaxID=1904961 RepID=UPI0009596D6D|nr:FHA domain-containing protein [Actinomadura sp. CNU-125]OLT38458.1 hypothetical protein BJF79_26845 [Actinomadura sp. CNU-125]
MRADRSLILDAGAAHFLVDVSNVVRDRGLLPGPPALLERFDALVAGLAERDGEGAPLIYAVADDSLLSDRDLPRADRDRLAAWLDGGLLETRDVADDRLLQLADLTELPVITDDLYREYMRIYPWIPGSRDRFLEAFTPKGAPRLVRVRWRRMPVLADWEISRYEEERDIKDAGLRARVVREAGRRWLGRRWRCPEERCVFFGERRIGGGQPLPRFSRRGAFCPLHRAQLIDAGPAPARRTLKVRVDGTVVTRFTVTEGTPVVVGRAPGDDGIALKEWLDDAARARISRRHVEVEVTEAGVFVRDVSTNGTLVRGAGDSGEPRRLHRGESRALGKGHAAVLHDTVTLELSGRKYVFTAADDDRPGPVDPGREEATVLGEAAEASER